MRCQRCGHLADQHDGHNQCQIRVLTDWNESRRAFAGERPCGCTGYRAPPTANKTGCPHERVKDSTNCVHCGQAVVENA
jgi:rubredoxin